MSADVTTSAEIVEISDALVSGPLDVKVAAVESTSTPQVKTVEQLLKELQVALASSQIFPADQANINFDFNLADGTVTATTDTKDENGNPLYSVVFSEPVKAKPEEVITAEP